MARRKVGKRKDVMVDFASYCYLLNGIAGIGKTSLSYEVGKTLYGEDGIMILTVGQEPEPVHLGNILSDRAKLWSDLDEMIEDLVEYRNTDYKDLKLIAIDTVDEVFRLAEQEVLDLYNSTVVIDKRVKSIKQAFGGFQAGENKVVDIVVSTLFKLRDAGYGIFFIGHTKTKNKKDPMTDIEFEQLTSNLEAKYYTAIKDKVNVVCSAYIEREMNNLETVKDAFSKKEKQVGRIASEKRVIVFRDEEYAIDVKSHFEYIEPKIEFSAPVFIETILNAIKKQHDKFHGESTDKEIAEIKEKQSEEKIAVIQEKVQEEDNNYSELEINTPLDEDAVDVDKNKELIKEITTHYKVSTAEQKTQVKSILKDNGSTKFDPNLPTSMFEKILGLFK